MDNLLKTSNVSWKNIHDIHVAVVLVIVRNVLRIGTGALAFHPGPGGELHYFPSKPRFTRGRAAAGMGHGANMQQSAMCDTAPAHGCEMVRDKFASDFRRSERARVFQLENGSKWGFPRRRGAGSRARTAAISHFAVVPVFEFKHQSAARSTGRACPLGVN